MDRFQEMRVFATVVEAGSFVGATDALGLSKAAVSRQVAQLERRLGVRLLHRTTRRLSLTPEGEVFHVRCRDLLAAMDEAEAEAASATGEAHGTLRVNAPVSFGVLHLGPLWASFMEAHPRVTLEVTLTDRLVDLVEEGVDLAVRIGRLADSSLVSRRLSSTRVVLCASPGYIARHGAPRAPADLAHHQVLGYTLLAMGDTWEFDTPGGRIDVKVQPRLRANSGDLCRAAALADQGIILQPTFLVGEDLQAGRLVELLPGCSVPPLGIHAVVPSRKHMPVKVRLLIEHLARAFATPRWPDGHAALTPGGGAAHAAA